MNRNEVNRFAVNPTTLDISRSIFNRDHKMLFSGNVGDVIPFYCTEILPGDTISVTTSKVVRLQPLVTPIMDNLYLDTYYFFVPNRIVWSHWKEFMGENTSTAWVPAVSYTIPQIEVPSGGFDVGTIADYLGVPPKTGAGKTVSALPFRAYAAIVSEWFRDENLMNPVHVHVDDTTRTGVNTGDQVTDIELGGKPFIACKYHDYFTSCLPGAQKAAGPTVEFALNGLLPVNAYNGRANLETGEDYSTKFKGIVFKDVSTSSAAVLTGKQDYHIQSGQGKITANDSSLSEDSRIPSPANLFADLNNTSIFDINSLRQAFAIQRFYEKQARGGSRYIEIIKSFFNVDSPDARLQRPEYLGGNRLPLNVSQVEQTSATQSGLTPQGNLTGVSATGDVNADFRKSFTEHGYIIGVCVVRYHHTYQQGLARHWSRQTLFDYYNPTFANLGEMAVMENEIYFGSARNNVFGYQEAWADYRYTPSRVAGEMRSVYTTPLDMWHLADNYASQPYLSDSWIREDKSNLDRCLAVTSAVSNQFIADFYIQEEAARPMPLYSIPGLIDHH